jgi:hypothetical protein
VFDQQKIPAISYRDLNINEDKKLSPFTFKLQPLITLSLSA